MERILRGQGEWQQAIAEGIARTPRPIPVDPRLAPRDRSSDDESVGVPRFDRATFPPARRAATLLLLYPATDGELTIPLTVRQAALRRHAGEISLPGGAVDAADPSLESAALREAWEEIGVAPASVQVLGALDDVWIPVSNYELRPFVAASAQRPTLVPHSGEVAAILELPLRVLAGELALTEELIEGRGWRLRAGVYRFEEHRIWGATARVLAMFVAVLRTID